MNKNIDIISPLKRLLDSKNYTNSIKYYNDIRSDLTFAIERDDDTLYYYFYGSPELIEWLNKYSTYIANLKSYEIKNNEKAIFNSFIEKYGYEKLVIYLKDSKLINPYKSYSIPSSIEKASNNVKQQFIDTIFLDFNTVAVHRGFVKLFNNVSPFIFRTIKKALTDKTIKQIRFVGFSIGSTISRLSFLSSVLYFPEFAHKFESYNYSTIKLGNKRFEFLLNSLCKNEIIKCYNINIKSDPFIYLIPDSIGFVKVRNRIMLEGNKTIKKYDEKTYLKALKL